jgi:outer membrane protein, multidrug efflux system
MIRPSHLTALLAALLLAGCVNLAPDYQQPEAPIPQQWPTRAELGSASPQIGWQTFFLDARLRQVIDQALANNRDLRVAALNVEKAGPCTGYSAPSNCRPSMPAAAVLTAAPQPV